MSPRRRSRTSAPKITSRPPRRSRRDRSSDASKWKWLVAAVGGLLLLAIIAFAALNLLGGSDSKPDQTPSAMIANVTIAVTPSASASKITETATLEPTLEPTNSIEPTPTSKVLEPNLPALQQFMHQLVNQDREENGLLPLAWDVTAANAGINHANEMSQNAYLSHYNQQGYGPDHRYSQAGGLNIVRENVYYYAHSPGAGPQSLEEWQALVVDAQKSLMGSDGHRENILAPEHTHVGIGIAYDADNGRLSIAQEFVNLYIQLQPTPSPLPYYASLGQTITLQGRLLNGAGAPVVNLAYEPLPIPMSIKELEATNVYQSSADNYDVISPSVNEGRFTFSVTLNHQDQPGLYHVRIWVETAEFGSFQVVNLVFEIQ